MRTALSRATLGASFTYTLFVTATAIGARPGVGLASWPTLFDIIDTAIALAIVATDAAPGAPRRPPRLRGGAEPRGGSQR